MFNLAEGLHRVDTPILCRASYTLTTTRAKKKFVKKHSQQAPRDRRAFSIRTTRHRLWRDQDAKKTSFQCSSIVTLAQ